MPRSSLRPRVDASGIEETWSSESHGDRALKKNVAEMMQKPAELKSIAEPGRRT